MSYEIVYARQFIKTPKGIIPLVLCGSNNCTEFRYGRERREREWGTMFDFFFTKPLYEESEIKTIVDDICEKYKENNQWFVFRNKWVYNKELQTFYKNGAKKALTLEEIITNSNISYVRCHVAGRNHNFSYPEENYFISELEQDITSTPELLKWIEKATQLEGTLNQQEKINVFINICFPYNDPIKFHKNLMATYNFKDDELVYGKIGKHYITLIDENGWRSASPKKPEALILPFKEFKLSLLKRDYGSRLTIHKYTEKEFEKAKQEAEENYRIILNGNNFVRLSRGGYRYSSWGPGSSFGTLDQVAKVIKKIRNKLGNSVEIKIFDVKTRTEVI